MEDAFIDHVYSVADSFFGHVYCGRFSLVMCTVEDFLWSCILWKTFFGHVYCGRLFDQVYCGRLSLVMCTVED